MAQLIEITSVIAAEHRIKKPLKVPRPPQVTSRRVDSERTARRAADADTNPYRAAIAALGGAQPSPKREQLAAAPDADGMTPPPPRGSYLGAMVRLGAAQPRRGGDAP